MNQDQMLKEKIIVIIGLSRAGTTFLYHNLQRHPDIYMPVRKELGYFSYHYDKKEEWYLSFFRKRKPHQVSFDISGMYFMDNQVIDRILNFNPQAKVICGLRNPQEWIFSLYEQYKQNFNVPPLGRFLDGCIIQREGKDIHLTFDKGFIQRRVRELKSAFGSNLLLYDFNLLAANPLQLLRGIEDFIAVDRFFKPGNFSNTKFNARGRRRTDFFYKYLHKQGLIDLILKLFPEKLIVATRNFVDRLSAGKIKKSNGSQLLYKYTKEEFNKVKERFEGDADSIEKLFVKSPLILGSGEERDPA